MARNPLAIVARLRDLEVQAARRALLDREADLAAAEARIASAGQALHDEAVAGDPAAYAAWLPRARADQAAAEAARLRAAAAAEEARAALAAARAAAHAIERMQQERALLERKKAERLAELQIDAWAAHRYAKARW